MIVWLASYPKSGNTLLRSILASYFFSNDGIFNFKNLNNISQFPLLNHFTSLEVDMNDDKEIFKNFIKAQHLINKEKGKIKFFKTHSSFCKVYDHNFTDTENTLGAIYIVRDPRNVVTSVAHHYDLSISEATKTMIDRNKFMEKTDKNFRVFVGSWNFSFNSWKQLPSKKYLLIKYEDLITKKKTTLLKVFKFLNSLGMKFDLDMIKLNKVIKTTEFENMKIKETEEIFSEAMIDVKTGKRKIFFNLGPKNDWRKYLDQTNKNKIEKSFEKEMIELGYL